MENQNSFQQWAIVELFGHCRLAGKVSSQQIGSSSFVRVDVPEMDGIPAFSKLYGEKAIYCITPVTEDVARRYLRNLNPEPLNVFMLRDPERAMLPDHSSDNEPEEDSIF